MKKKLLSVILILSMLLGLTACMPQWYTDEDVAKFEKTGNVRATKWFNDNMPDAVLDEDSITISYDSFGLHDLVYGEYELDDKTHKFLYVVGSESMYTDELYHTASDAVAEMYAKGFGLSNYRVKEEETDKVTFYVEYKNYADKKGDGVYEVTDEDGFFAYVPYDLTEDDLGDYLEDESKRSPRYHGSGIAYIVDTDKISVSSAALAYLKDHPFFDSFDIYSKNMDYRIHLKVGYNKENDAPDSIEVWHYTDKSIGTVTTATDGKPTTSHLERNYEKTEVYDFDTLKLRDD